MIDKTEPEMYEVASSSSSATTWRAKRCPTTRELVRIHGAGLRALRDARYYSRGDVATACGVSPEAVRQYEIGASVPVSAVARRLIDCLGGAARCAGAVTGGVEP